jgi:transposase
VAPIHNSQAFWAKEKQWAQQGITLKRIPAYCPELNLIEILWRKIKYDWIPFNAYQTLDKLIHEVEQIIRDVGKRFVINFD